MEELQPYKEQCQPFAIDGIIYYINKRYRSYSPINNYKLKKTKLIENKYNLKKKIELNNVSEPKKMKIK